MSDRAIGLTADGVVELARRVDLNLSPTQATELVPLLQQLLEAADRFPVDDPAGAGWAGDPFDASRGSDL
ncbi:MAG TPA: hypothetical protein VMW47_01365 [Verrucomicrobiae bacterium]|nr:hypothetical protein [Verrucomicrobiae bacterium]